MPRRVIAVYLLVDLSAITLVIFAAFDGAGTVTDWLVFAMLLFMGVLHAELARKVEQIRRLVAGVPHINMTSVWNLAAAILLPSVLAGALAVGLYFHLWLRVWSTVHRPARKAVYDTAMIVISGLAAAVVAGQVRPADPASLGDLAVLVAAGITFFVVNGLLVALIRAALAGRVRGTQLTGDWDDYSLELATLCLGIIVALMVLIQPASIVLISLPVVLLHRGVLVKQVQKDATIDGKTGLLNALTWRTIGEREFAKARQDNSAGGLMMIDLDHFKRINDTYGHLAGDEVLKAIGEVLLATTRKGDTIGRFGGEEFVVLMPEATLSEVHAAAERIRQKVTEMTVPVGGGAKNGATIVGKLSVSIGIAEYPRNVNDIIHALSVADAAVYAAKEAGRNRVVAGAVS